MSGCGHPKTQTTIPTTNVVETQTDAMGAAEGIRAIECKPYKAWGTRL
jgi:hypothetical protein